MKSNSIRILVLAAAMGLSGAGQAALHDRGSGLIYDDVLNITWLQDANYAKTSLYSGATSSIFWSGTPGAMTWENAKNWADQLVYGGYSDWRLPSVMPVNGSEFNYDYSSDGTTDVGFNNTSANSELAHLFYVTLGNVGQEIPTGGYGGCGITTSCWTHLGPFTNLGTLWGEDYPAYWTATASGRNPNTVWAFDGFGGYQTDTNATNGVFAWAVRDGDVAAVPEPETYALMLAGLGLVGFAARRRGG